MLSVTFFFNQTDQFEFWAVWAINSFLGIWMTIEQIKLSGFLIRPIWTVQIGGPTKIHDLKMHVFFQKTYLKIHFYCNIFCALVLFFRLTTIALTTSLGIVLRHFRECISTTGGREQWISLSETLIFCQIWESTDPNLRCGKMLGVLPGKFTAPYPRWWTYTTGNASGESLGVLWELCGPSGTAERSHRRCCTKHGVWDNVFEKKHAFLGHGFFFEPRFGGVKCVGSKIRSI